MDSINNMKLELQAQKWDTKEKAGKEEGMIMHIAKFEEY
jgi:hypothetical protein